jgi:cyclopropane fatty-acyl-phospholipid synthase-like methyltransferase
VSLAPRFDHVTCVDLSAGALRVLEERVAARGITNVSTVVCDLCELPAGLGPFDAAWSCETLQHIPGEAMRRTTLFRIRQVMRAGARLVVTTLARNRRVREDADGFWPGGAYRHHFVPGELADLIASAGFRDVSVRGMLMVPGRIGRRLPSRAAALDLAASRLPRSADFGRFLIATAHA